jgi:hypothetical protein
VAKEKSFDNIDNSSLSAVSPPPPKSSSLSRIREESGENWDAENTKGGSITVPLTSCLTGLDYSVLEIKTKIVSSLTADFKPVKQEVYGTVILPSLLFLVGCLGSRLDEKSIGKLPVIPRQEFNSINQGILTERESSVQLTSLLR